jgi:hypothetical protein
MGHLLIYSQHIFRDFNCCRLQTHTFRLEDRRHCNEWLELLQLAVADVNDAEGGDENPLLTGLGAGVGLAPAAPPRPGNDALGLYSGGKGGDSLAAELATLMAAISSKGLDARRAVVGQQGALAAVPTLRLFTAPGTNAPHFIIL